MIGSQDCILKLWPLPEAVTSKKLSQDPNCDPIAPQAVATQRAHDKDINSVAVSPNNKLLASGSQDQTAKLWSLPDFSLLGVFSSHWRSVWCVWFFPMD